MADLIPEDYPGGGVRLEFRLLAGYRLENSALTAAELARMLGRSAQTVLVWLRKPEYQRYENWVFTKNFESLPPEVRDARTRVQEKLTEYSEEMADRLLVLLETSEDPKFQAQIAQDWLDRSGHVAQRKQEAGGTQFILTADAIRELRRRSEEAGFPSNLAGDTDVRVLPDLVTQAR
jgi:hypothetical protein